MSREPEFITPMQAAFMATHLDDRRKPSRLGARVLKALDRAKPVKQREQVRVSYRTAQKLKQEGVL